MFGQIAERIREIFRFSGYLNPVEWSKKNIDLSGVKGIEKKKIDFDFAPYLIDPIMAWDFKGVKKEVTIVAPEQTGKTFSWICGLLWTFIVYPTLSLVVYKSDEYAERINSDKLRPMLEKIESLAAEMMMPRSNKKDHYNFSNLKSYFQGSGARITSMTGQIAVADELDDWIGHENEVSPLDDLRKRLRFADESILYKVCTVKNGGIVKSSPIWNEFLNTSQGYYTLCCLKCGGHTMRSCDTHHLQFEANEEGELIEGSCRLICPTCGYSHTEDKHRDRMIAKGKYIHRYPERMRDNIGFQWGCLAVKIQYFSWDNIAKAQLEAGASGDLNKQILFDNSFRGLPLKKRHKNEKHEKALVRHCSPLPDDKEFKYRLFSADTQDNGWFWVARGFDVKRNSYLLANGFARTKEDLVEVWEGVYNGGRCVMGIIDHGGHRSGDVAELSLPRKGLYMYKGSGRDSNARWRPSKNSNKLFLANPHIYKAELLYAIHGSTKKDNNYWYLPEQIDDDYSAQLLDLRPDNKKKSGHEYVNWEGSNNDHYFDAEKMMLVIHEIFIHLARKKK
jgi:hypothetical protein